MSQRLNNDRCLIIAEAGVNHNGRLDLALQLCDAAKDSGADVVKFQTWDTDRLITKNVGMATYQEKNTREKVSQYDMLKQLEFSYDNFKKVKAYCDEIGIIFASTADEEKSLDFLIGLGIPFIKIGSGDVGNVSYLRYIGGRKLPIIFSTGMSSLSDIDVSLDALYQGGAEDVTLLHVTTNYPCPHEEVNLNAMLTLQNAFHLPVGYSDHTTGTEVAVAAVALGAKIIEKHFTLDRNLSGPDHIASTEPGEFKQMVKQIRNIETAMGNGIKKMTVSERKIKPVVTKRIVALKPIRKGDVFSQDNICVKRSIEGEYAVMWDRVVGRSAKKDYIIDQGILL